MFGTNDGEVIALQGFLFETELYRERTSETVSFHAGPMKETSKPSNMCMRG